MIRIEEKERTYKKNEQYKHDKERIKRKNTEKISKKYYKRVA